MPFVDPRGALSPHWGGSPHWAEMAGLSRRQDGVLDILQLRALGFSDDRVGLLVQQGRLIRRHRGVYQDALMKTTQRGHLLAAQRALGDAAFLGRRTALGLVMQGLRVASPSLALVEVAARETDRELDRLIAELARRRLLDLEQIDSVIARLQRHDYKVIRVTEFCFAHDRAGILGDLLGMVLAA